jgi:hypothetical protein
MHRDDRLFIEGYLNTTLPTRELADASWRKNVDKDVRSTLIVEPISDDMDPRAFFDKLVYSFRKYRSIHNGRIESIDLLVDGSFLGQLYAIWASCYLCGPKVVPVHLGCLGYLRQVLGLSTKQPSTKTYTIALGAIKSLWEEMVTKQSIIIDGLWIPVNVAGEMPEIKWQGVQCPSCIQVQ